MINVVLVNPEIPNNTGNIVRTCAVTGAKLHIIEPCGFSWEDKYLKRSGLDYWEISDVNRYENMQAFLQANFADGADCCDNVAIAVKNTKIKSGRQFFSRRQSPTTITPTLNTKRIAGCFSEGKQRAWTRNFCLKITPTVFEYL